MTRMAYGGSTEGPCAAEEICHLRWWEGSSCAGWAGLLERKRKGRDWGRGDGVEAAWKDKGRGHFPQPPSASAVLPAVHCSAAVWTTARLGHGARCEHGTERSPLGFLISFLSVQPGPARAASGLQLWLAPASLFLTETEQSCASDNKSFSGWLNDRSTNTKSECDLCAALFQHVKAKGHAAVSRMGILYFDW